MATRAKELLRRARVDDVHRVLGDAGWELRLVAQDGRDRRRSALAEGRHAREHLVEDAPERPDVAALVGQAVLELLRRQIRRRPDDLLRAREHVALTGFVPALRDPEVDQHHAALGSDEQIGRLEIAVDDPGVVRGDQRLGRLHRVLEGDVGGERPSLGEDALQIRAPQVIHRDPGRPLVLAGAVHAHHSRMVDGREGARLAHQATARGARHQLRGEHLEHHALAVFVAREIEDTHSALRQRAFDHERTDGGPRFDGESR